MNCEKFRGLYDLLIDVERGRGELDAKTLEELRRHRQECPNCRSELQADDVLTTTLTKELRRTVLMVGSFPCSRLGTFGFCASTENTVPWTVTVAR